MNLRYCFDIFFRDQMFKQDRSYLFVIIVSLYIALHQPIYIINWCHLYNNLMRKVLIPPIYRWEMWVTESFSNFPQVTQLIKSQIWIWNQELPPESMLLTTIYPCFSTFNVYTNCQEIFFLSDYNSAGLRWSPRFCISNKLLGAADNLRTTFWLARHYTEPPLSRISKEAGSLEIWAGSVPWGGLRMQVPSFYSPSTRDCPHLHGQKWTPTTIATFQSLEREKEKAESKQLPFKGMTRSYISLLHTVH